MAMKKQPDGISRARRGDEKFDEHGKALPPTEWDILFGKDVIGQTIREPKRKWRAVSVKPGAPFPELFSDWSQAIVWLLETWHSEDVGIGAFTVVSSGEESDAQAKGEAGGIQAGDLSVIKAGHKEQDDSLFASKVSELAKADESLKDDSDVDVLPPEGTGIEVPGTVTVTEAGTSVTVDLEDGEPPVTLEADVTVVAVSDTDAGLSGDHDAADATEVQEVAEEGGLFDDDSFAEQSEAADLTFANADKEADPFAPDFDPFAAQ